MVTNEADLPPFPPDEYMALVCGPFAPSQLRHEFQVAGLSLIDGLERLGMLDKDVRLLDVGCGCGRLARYLIEKPLASYVGFDRHLGMIDWCRQQITSRFPKFDFRHFDIKSTYQNIDGQEGTIPARDFKFPFADGAFDCVVLASVFTHMPMAEIHHYLSEIRRILSPEGAAVLSIFLTDQKEEYTAHHGVNFHIPRDKFLASLDYHRFYYDDDEEIEKYGHKWFLILPLPDQKPSVSNDRKGDPGSDRPGG